MIYRIVIEKVETAKAIRKGEWEVVEKRPMTEEEFAKADRAYREKPMMKEIFGYTPDKEVQETVTTKILQQEVEDLDVAAVIKAINKL